MQAAIHEDPTARNSSSLELHAVAPSSLRGGKLKRREEKHEKHQESCSSASEENAEEWVGCTFYMVRGRVATRLVVVESA